ncbi:MAG: alanine racemase [Calditrichaeota bacterium]|nr:MAG: alanine racemase [Calditrichota bacterium]
MVEQHYLNNTWIEISESAYEHNLKFFRKLIGEKTELSVVVKANAYGHGWQSIARLAMKHGADSFCVHSIDEALRLRRAGFHQPILIMGHIPLNRLEEAVQEKFRIVVFNRETVERLDQITTRLSALARIHLKLETGTYRQGIDASELDWYITKLKNTPRVVLEAVYTHFANIEDTTNHDYANFQKYTFNQMVKIIKDSGFPILKRHIACTAAILLFPDTHMDMVRLGIGQYGLWPSRETFESYKKNGEKNGEKLLLPVLTWKARITQLKWVDAEHTIGYGRTFKTTRKTRIAVIPVGYSDGYDRGLSNQGYVLVHGKRAPVRGRVCMNLMMVDVTDIPKVKLEDEVVLIGNQGKEQITADELANWSGTINYEIVSRINSDIPRIIVK